MWVKENDNASKSVFPKSTEVLNKSDSDDEDKDQGASSGDCHEPKKKEMSMTMLLLSTLVDIQKITTCQRGTDSWHGLTKATAGPQGVGFYGPSHKSVSFASPTLITDDIGALMGFGGNNESPARNYSPSLSLSRQPSPPPCRQSSPPPPWHHQPLEDDHHHHQIVVIHMDAPITA